MYVDSQIAAIVGGEDVSANFDTLKEVADALGDLKVVDVEAAPAVEGEHYTQEEIDAAQEGDEAYGKTVDDWKVEPVEAIEEQSHNMTIGEFVNTSMQKLWLMNIRIVVAISLQRYSAKMNHEISTTKLNCLKI